MLNLKLILAAARVVAVLAIAAVFIKVAPTLASHAAGHSATYSAGAAAPVQRAH